MSLLSRRSLLLTGISFALAEAAGAQTPLSSNPDVVIIGAGAAGIAAARELSRFRRSVVVLEARARVGGRASTESTSLGVAFDRGAGWIHNSTVNPLTPLLSANGFQTIPSDRNDGWAYLAGARASNRVVTSIEYGEAQLYRDAVALVGGGVDAPLSRAIGQNAFKSIAAAIIGAGDIGVDPSDISIQDLLNLSEAEGDLRVLGGAGAAVASLARGLPIQLSARADHVTWGSASGIEVRGGFGTLRARAAIVTLPTNLLVDGSIAFSPSLPAEFRDSFDNLPLGAMLKIAFRLSRAHPDYPEYAVGLNEIRAGRANVMHWDNGARVATILVGGAFARTLSAAPAPDVYNAGETILADIFGASVRSTIASRTYTNWTADPLSKGSYAVARPGYAQARSIYGRSLRQGRLVFAGEAGGGDLAMTLGGAWQSGVAAATTVHGAL